MRCRKSEGLASYKKAVAVRAPINQLHSLHSCPRPRHPAQGLGANTHDGGHGIPLRSQPKQMVLGSWATETGGGSIVVHDGAPTS